MDLKAKITADLTESLKNGDNEKVGVPRFLKAGIQNKEIEKRSKEKESVLTDEEIQEVVRREAKKRKESMEIYEKAGRNDLKAKEESELEIIKKYLPKEASSEAVETAVKEAIKSGADNFGSVMKLAMQKLKGTADGKVVSEVVKKMLG